MSSISHGVVSWLLTYMVHSTVLLGMAWLVLRLRRADAASADLLWKVALVGGLVTATVQTGFDLRPAGSVALLPALETAAPTTNFASPEFAPANRTAAAPVGRTTPVGLTPATSLPSSGEPVAAAPVSIAAVVAFGWMIAALALVLWYVGRRLILVGRLGDRRVIADGELPGMLAELSSKAGVTRRLRLTASHTISSPVALGGGEICLPAAALVELNHDQQTAMMAHELAHLVRRDPHWLVFACLMERAFFFQPLNRLARRGIQESAEYMADEWAARRTGGVPLARCLVKVAEWIQASPLGVPVAGFAEERSQLATRVTRLIETSEVGAPRSRRLAAFASVGVLVVTAAFAPGVAARAPQIADAEVNPGNNPMPVSVDLGVDVSRESDGSRDLERVGTDRNSSRNSRRNSNTNDGVRDAADQFSLDADDAAVLERLALTDELPDGFVAVDTAVVRALMLRLKDENAEVREAAADALGRIENPMAIPALIEAMNDPEIRVSYAAMHALSNFEEGVPVAPIRRMLTVEDPEIRAGAIEVLGDMKDVGSVGIIAGMVEDPSSEVRYHAIQALGEIGSRESIGAIRRALGDSDDDVRWAALETLDDLDEKIDDAIIRRSLSDANSEIRQQAAYIAANRKMVSLAPQLVKLLDDSDSDIRQTALEALDEMDIEVPGSALNKAMADRSEDVRSAAIEIIGERQMTSMVPTLIRMLEDPSSDVRETAAEALTEMRTQASRAALRTAMNHQDSNVRRIAVEYFGEESDS